jgi:hypothetical protein
MRIYLSPIGTSVSNKCARIFSRLEIKLTYFVCSTCVMFYLRWDHLIYIYIYILHIFAFIVSNKIKQTINPAAQHCRVLSQPFIIWKYFIEVYGPYCDLGHTLIIVIWSTHWIYCDLVHTLIIVIWSTHWLLWFGPHIDYHDYGGHMCIYYLT